MISIQKKKDDGDVDDENLDVLNQFLPNLIATISDVFLAVNDWLFIE